ncbi:MAG: hypothetical protein EOM77_02580 [Bacteroidia bacterium]|nr:hypothetical protein [Bacteroidia bacterium]
MDKKAIKERRKRFATLIDALYRDSRNATKKYVESLIYPDGKAHISVDLTNIDELYSPYSYKEDMKPDIFEYIDEKTYYTPVEIPLIVNFDVGDVSDLRRERIKRSFLDHYRLIYEDKRRELKINRVAAWILFAIGMSALIVSTVAKLAINAASIPDIPLVFEMLQIFSWVFLWEAISKFIFQGREMRTQCMNAGQLALAEVKFNEPEPELKDKEK